MSLMWSQITGVAIVCSTICSGADQRKHQRFVSLAFVSGNHWWPVVSLHKGPAMQKMFPFDNVIMIDDFTVPSGNILVRLSTIWIKNVYCWESIDLKMLINLLIQPFFFSKVVIILRWHLQYMLLILSIEPVKIQHYASPVHIQSSTYCFT